VSPVNWGSSGAIKIERAKEHIRYLEGEITALKERRPYEAIPEDEPESGDYVLRARIREQLPLRWGAIAGDVIHNLRSALDLLWRQVRSPNASAETPTEKFPFFNSLKALETRLAREKKGRAKASMKVVKAINAYKGGNDLLGLLRTVDDINQHRLLLPAHAAVGSTIMDMSVGQAELWAKSFPDRPKVSFPPMPIEWIWIDPVCPVENGTELYRVRAAARGPVVDMNPKIPYEIAFCEPEILKRKPVIATLNQFFGEVEGIAETFIRAGLLA
jgi:hypothetical protein